MMGSERFDDEQWDESRWEQHIDDIERRSGELRDFITATCGPSSPAWKRLLVEYGSQNEAMDAYIEEELMYEEAYFPEDDDYDDDDDDDPDNDLFMSDEDADDDENFDAEESWKRLINELEEIENSDNFDFRLDDIEYLEDMEAYMLARDFGIRVLGLAKERLPEERDEMFERFIESSLRISTKLATGFSFGFEPDVIGGNITYCKKALAYANEALDLLRNLKHRSWFAPADYYEVHEQLCEVRNETGMYIQDLRVIFNNPEA